MSSPFVTRLGFAAVALLCVALATPTAAPAATVNLSLTDNDATPTYARVGPDGTVVISVRINSTEQTTGLDYYLRVSPLGSGHFRLDDRSLAGSDYPIPYQDDTTVEASPGSILDTDNDFDLGGAVVNVNSPKPPGNFLVANLSIKVLPTAPIGFYTITTFSQPGTGWVAPVGAVPPEGEFNNHGTFTLEVPEPTALGLIPLAAAAFIRRRRTSQQAD